MSYSSKTKKALGNVKQSAATKNAQKNRNDYDKKLSAIGPYRNGTFAKMVEGAVDDILNRRAQSSNFGNADVFGDYARDYAALSKLAAADTQTNAEENMAGGYDTDYTVPAAQQSYMNGLAGQNEDLLSKLSTANQIRSGEMENKAAGGQRANEAGAFDYQKYQDKVEALQNARSLWDAAVEKTGAVDSQAYSDNLSFLSDMAKYEGNLGESKADRALSKWKADQEYQLDVLQWKRQQEEAAKAAKAAKASRSSRSSRSSGRGGYGAGFDTGGKGKKKVKLEYHGVPKSEILALGYGPISEAKFDDLIDSKDVLITKDKNGNLHVKKRNVSIPPNPGKPNFSLGTKLF
jgi:hypothetical protein